MADDSWLFEDVHLAPAMPSVPLVGLKPSAKQVMPLSPPPKQQSGARLDLRAAAAEQEEATPHLADAAVLDPMAASTLQRDWSVADLLNIPFPSADVSNIGNLGVKKLKDFERGVARSMILPPAHRLSSVLPTGSTWGHVAARAESDVMLTGGLPMKAPVSSATGPGTWLIDNNAFSGVVTPGAALSSGLPAAWRHVPPPSDASVAAALARSWPAAAYFASTGTLLLQGGELVAEADSAAAAGAGASSAASASARTQLGSAVKKPRRAAAGAADAPEVDGSSAPSAAAEGAAAVEEDNGSGAGSLAAPAADADAAKPVPDLLAFDARHLRVWYPPVCKGKAPPPGLSGHSFSVIRDAASGQEFGIIFGGVRGRHYSCDTYLLNPRSLRWQQVKTFGKAPTQRAHHAAAAVDGGRKLLVFGGCNGADCFNDVYALDCAGGVSAAASEERWTWSQPPIRGRAPRPRAGAVATVIADRFVIMTGGVSPCDPAPLSSGPGSEDDGELSPEALAAAIDAAEEAALSGSGSSSGSASASASASAGARSSAASKVSKASGKGSARADAAGSRPSRQSLGSRRGGGGAASASSAAADDDGASGGASAAAAVSDLPSLRPGRLHAMLQEIISVHPLTASAMDASTGLAAAGGAASAASDGAGAADALTGAKRKRDGAQAVVATPDAADAAAADAVSGRCGGCGGLLQAAGEGSSASPAAVSAALRTVTRYFCRDVWALDTVTWEWLQLRCGTAAAATTGGSATTGSGCACAAVLPVTCRVGHSAVFIPAGSDGGAAVAAASTSLPGAAAMPAPAGSPAGFAAGGHLVLLGGARPHCGATADAAVLTLPALLCGPPALKSGDGGGSTVAASASSGDGAPPVVTPAVRHSAPRGNWLGSSSSAGAASSADAGSAPASRHGHTDDASTATLSQATSSRSGALSLGSGAASTASASGSDALSCWSRGSGLSSAAPAASPEFAGAGDASVDAALSPPTQAVGSAGKRRARVPATAAGATPQSPPVTGAVGSVAASGSAAAAAAAAADVDNDSDEAEVDDVVAAALAAGCDDSDD